MKKRILYLTAVFYSLVVGAQQKENILEQTPQEILGKMSEVMNVGPEVGVALTTDMKIPILGTFSTRVYTLGERSRMEMSVKEKEIVTWVDGTTTYFYDAAENEIVIDNLKDGAAMDGSDNLGLADHVTEGYDVQLQQETDKYWDFHCIKRKDNKDKDAPKAMDISVWKESFLLRSLKATVKGVTVTLRDISFGVGEKDVNFDLSLYKDAKIVDKRKQK